MPHVTLFRSLTVCALLGIVMVMVSCAPATTGLAPTGSLVEQLNAIRAEQQQQALQYQQLVQELTALKQQLNGEEMISARIEGGVTQEPTQEPNAVTTPLPEPPVSFNFPQEVTTVAASASSYLGAFSALAAGQWSAAEQGFEAFLQNYPDHQYSPNARYWLANAQLSQGKTDLAIANLRQVFADPRGQTKAPAALAQLAQLYRRQGLTSQADEVVEQLHIRFPESPEAQHFYRSEETNN
ncbi:MAG: tetratricopeptide repeat protein [Desulfuromonadales bacterium]|nr:tetratricopeptide repeat protein [Desulfuromonadales bacterium]MBN2791788.1 tetratricopeptide repeat protein [Desulfuromonadales bacterium]